MVKNIMFITVALQGGGAERVMVTIANQMVKKGYHVTFLLVISDEVVYSLDPGIQIVKINNGRHRAVRQLLNIRKELKKFGPGTVISFFTNLNILTILANIGLKNKVIVSERFDPHFTGKNKLVRFIRNYVYAIADKIIFQTKDAYDYFPKPVRRKGIIIPNPIKDNLPHRYTGEREKRIVAYSRLSKEKNIPLLLDACKDIFDRHDDYVLDIYGTGELEAELIDYTKKLGIDNRVNYNGFCMDVHNRIRKAAMYVSSSDVEGLSNSMLEAMAVGIPSICTDCPAGGARMFIKPYENGILIPVSDVNAMVTAMEYVINSNELADKLSKNASKIRGILSVANIFEKWDEII